jgi:hypothetical protein
MDFASEAHLGAGKSQTRLGVLPIFIMRITLCN